MVADAKLCPEFAKAYWARPLAVAQCNRHRDAEQWESLGDKTL